MKLLFLIFILLCSSFLFASNEKKIEWLSFEKAVKLAHEENKYIFIEFYADWCGFCKKMDATSLKDPRVVTELKKNFTSIKIDVESDELIEWKNETITQKDFSDYMEIQQLPSILFAKAEKPNELEFIGYFASFVDSETLNNLLKYISSGSREEGLSFEEFKTPSPPPLNQ